LKLVLAEVKTGRMKTTFA